MKLKRGGLSKCPGTLERMCERDHLQSLTQLRYWYFEFSYNWSFLYRYGFRQKVKIWYIYISILLIVMCFCHTAAFPCNFKSALYTSIYLVPWNG